MLPDEILTDPAQLTRFGELDPKIALELLEIRRTELHLEKIADEHAFMAHTQQITLQYRYARTGLAIAGVGLFAVLGGFVYLVSIGHTGEAAVLLGAGILSLIGAFLKTRLD